MKISKFLKVAAIAVGMTVASSKAAITITNSVSAPIQDGSSLNYAYSVADSSSVLVAGFYSDSADTVTDVLYGGDSATGFITNNTRMVLAYWLNPATGSNNFTQTGIASFNPGLLLGVIELADVDKTATVNSGTGGSITTLTDNEFVVSFTGNNGDGSHAPTAGSIIDTPLTIPSFDTTAVSVDDSPNTVGGGGSVAGGTGLAGLAGSQDVSWDSGDTVSYSFVAIPEPSTVVMLLGALGMLAFLRRRSV